MGSIRKLTKNDGTDVFHAEVRLRGYDKQRQSFRTKTQAKKWIQDTEAAIRDGRHKGLAAGRKHTVGELIDRFIKQCVPQHPIYYPKKVQLLQRWKDELGSLLLRDLSPSAIAGVRDKLLAETTSKNTKRSPGTVNRYLATFSKALSVASKEWEWMDASPMQKVRKLKESRGRDRCLSYTEKENLLKACRSSKNPYLYHIVNLALLTGMRYGEIVYLRWNDINFDERYMTLQETKNGDRRVIPITNEIIQVFHSCPTYGDAPEELVFKSRRLLPIKYGISIRKSFTKALQEAGIKGFVFHLLRHTAATDLANEGATEGDLQEIFGWKTKKMASVYCHRSLERKRSLLERLGNGSTQNKKD
ncbi:MAG: tyrosine-type recombinase/integrase [Chlamydiales bacterium]|nr:tyrosine-type recombinase/integrase [Chlamydiales bacterium]